MSRQNDEIDAICYSAAVYWKIASGRPADSCDGCKHDLGGGCCRINVEAECREGGGFEMWEHRVPEEPEKLPEENRERPKLSKGDMILKWAAIVITAIAYPVVLYKVWQLWQMIR